MDWWVHPRRFEHIQEGMQRRLFEMFDVVLINPQTDVGISGRVSGGSGHHPQETGFLSGFRSFLFALLVGSSVDLILFCYDTQPCSVHS